MSRSCLGLKLPSWKRGRYDKNKFCELNSAVSASFFLCSLNLTSSCTAYMSLLRSPLLKWTQTLLQSEANFGTIEVNRPLIKLGQSRFWLFNETKFKIFPIFTYQSATSLPYGAFGYLFSIIYVLKTTQFCLNLQSDWLFMKVYYFGT